MFSEEGLKALQNARQNIENRRNSRKPLVVKPYGNYRDPEGKNGKWYYHDFVSQYDNEYTKKLKEKMKKNHESMENDPIINRYKLYNPNNYTDQYGVEHIKSPLVAEQDVLEQQKHLKKPQYQINKKDHGKDYLNFDGENLYFNENGEMLENKNGKVVTEYNKELAEARSALSSLKKKYAKKNSSKYKINESCKSTNYSEEESKFEFKDYSNKPNISFEKLNLSEIKKNRQSFIDDEMKNDYSYLFKDFDEKDINNTVSQNNEEKIDKIDKEWDFDF